MPRFGPFEVRGKLGTGGLADVFLGELAEPLEGVPEGPVALKVLRDLRSPPPVVDRFLREGRLLQRYAHPGLPACHAVLEAPRPTLVLERLQGEALSDRLLRGPLPIATILAMAEELLSVLTWLHGQGVVHRDVKPGNIQLEEGRVVLVDLGLALDPGEPFDVRRGEVIGTYAYMAPEQIAGAGADHRADLYSLGLTLYECVSGMRPYKARGAMNWLLAHTRGGAPALEREDLPSRLADLIGRLMRRDPSRRPQTAPLALAELTGHRDLRTELHSTELVGRDAAVGAIEGVLDAGGALLLVGEAGAGASRLVRAAWEKAEGRARIGVRCQPGHGMMRQLERALGQPLAGFEEPLAVFVEDLHAADPPSVTALSDLLRPGLSIVATSEHPVALGGHTVRLRDLTVDEVRLLIASMLGGPAPPGFAEELARFTLGLPTAVVITVQDYFRRGALSCDGVGEDGLPSWRVTGTLRMPKRNGLQRVWGGRLARLSQDAMALLRVLSIAHRPLSPRLAAAVAQVQAPLALHQLTRDGLVRQAEGRVHVARPALGALVGSALTEGERGAVHGGIAMALLNEPASPERQELLAWHMAMGAPPQAAAKALIGLAVDLRERGHPAEAMRVLLRLSFELDGPSAARAALVRSQVLLDLSRPGPAAEAGLAAVRLSSGLSPAVRVRAQAHRALVELHRGRVQEGLALSKAVLATHPAQPVALLVRATSLMLSGRAADAANAFTDLFDLQDEAVGAAAHGGLGSLRAHEGRLGEALRHTSQQLRFLRKRGSPAERVDVLTQLALLHLAAGDVDQCAAVVDEAAEDAEHCGLPQARALVDVARARLLLAVGSAQASADLLRQQLPRANEGSLIHRVQWLGSRVEMLLTFRDHGAALASANRALELATTAGWEGARAYYAGLVATLRADEAALEQALADLEACGDLLRRGRLLAHAALISSTPARLDRAVEAARSAGDLFIRLKVLHLSGGAEAAREAKPLAFTLLRRSSGDLRDELSRRHAVVWALAAR